MGRTKSRLQVAAVASAAIVAVVGFVGYFAIPAAARWGIDTAASRAPARAARVDSIGANPYTLRLTPNGLSVAGLPGEAAPVLTVQRITLTLRSLQCCA